jgi:hypothetical protein
MGPRGREGGGQRWRRGKRAGLGRRGGGGGGEGGGDGDGGVEEGHGCRLRRGPAGYLRCRIRAGSPATTHALHPSLTAGRTSDS